MKKIFILAFIATLGFTITSCKDKNKEIPVATEAEKAVKVKVVMASKSGSNVTGNAVFTQEGDEVTMVAMIEGLEPGTHAIHLHEKADCSSDDGTSSGGHWNPTAQPHGKWGDATGYHKGDIGNMEADDKGRVVKYFTTNEWCIGCGDGNKDILGKAIIVHQGTDDFTSQPSGNAGSRISCGGIIK